MIVAESLRMSLRSLWSHKLRSLMTILGVVFGVGSVLAVTSLGAAFEESITSQFNDLDDRSIFITASLGAPTQGPPDAGQFGLIFTQVDLEALQDIDGVDRVVAAGEVSVTRLSIGESQIPFRTLTATTPDADEVRNADDYDDGGPFALGEDEMVLGWSIAERLNADVGDTVTITYETGDEDTATVSGILAESDTLFGSGNGQVFVPVDPFYTVTSTSPSTDEKVRVYTGFTVFADDAQTIDATQERVETYMQDDSDASQLLQDDLIIIVSTPSDITAGIGAAFDQITIFIAGIAGVSLLVGGIMIGTIMLISVTERTKEIGMMKAIGGRDRDVLWMFLLEAAIIGLLGSIFGILMGIAGGAALIAGLFSGEDIGFVVPWNWVLISVIVGVGTGIIAGILPARRAVKIEPVEALSYE